MTYAIFATGGRQFRAEPGATIQIPLLAAEPGSKVTFDQVLLASDGKHVQTGKPVLKGARRTGYRRHAGHRQQFTEIKIADVKLKD